MSAHTDWLAELLREQYAPPVREWTGTTEGPSAAAERDLRRGELCEALQDPDLDGHATYERLRSNRHPIPISVLDAETRYQQRAAQRRTTKGAA